MRFANGVIGVLLAAGIALAPAVALAPETAFGVTYTGVSATLDDLLEIERSTNEYKDAQAAVENTGAKLAELQAQIEELAKEIAVQQVRTDNAVRSLYKQENSPIAVAEVLLQSRSLGDFLKELDYFSRVSRSNVEQINRLHDMNAQLENARAEQDRLKAEADARLEAARVELEALQDSRAWRQESGITRAKSQAASQGGEASIGVAYDGGEQPEDYREAATQDTAALSDGADWRADRDAFIEEWTQRIDAYLAGSPLEGQGVHFATSAWRYNIDPRWSPAISNTESSKGRHCIRPHNAWGWGAADADPYGLALEWDSWEAAIDAHIKGLSDGYGYTISMNGAKAYCPNTWQSWYNRTLTEMAKI